MSFAPFEMPLSSYPANRKSHGFTASSEAAFRQGYDPARVVAFFRSFFRDSESDRGRPLEFFCSLDPGRQ